jgi:DTW domain-containing protein YfiP
MNVHARHQNNKIDKKDACPECLRPISQCFCNRLTIQNNAIRLLVLQHPQEQYKLLNSARLTHKILGNSVVRVGLSWRNFRHALGEDADPREWGALFLKPHNGSGNALEIFDAKKRPVNPLPHLKGLVAIDGSWKQAKALWWRNPWLLRLNRITLNPAHRSLRAQVKREGLSTIEAVALALSCLGEDKNISAYLIDQYEELIIKPGLHDLILQP